MSFGPERAGRQQASGGSPAARIARRILLTGGCAVAGWLGASVLGAAAHAATPQHAAPVDSVLSSVTGGQSSSHGTHDLSGLDGVVARTTHLADPQHVTASLHHTVSSVLHQQNSSVTVHHHADSGRGALDATDLTGSVEHQVTHRVGQLTTVTKQVTKPVTQAVKPVADTVVKPITDVAQTATKPVTEPLAHGAPAPTTDLSAPVSTITGALTGSLATGTDAISLPGITELIHTPAPISLPAFDAQAGSLIHWTGAPRVLAHATIRHHATAQRRTTTHTAVAPRHTTGPVAGPVEHAIATVGITGARAVHLPVRRHPAAPLGPLAPPVPFGVAGGSAPSTTGGSGAAGANSPAALDSDADAPVQTLGTVDPTAASMARSVAKRPSTSPD